jgi:hypothetical protein
VLANVELLTSHNYEILTQNGISIIGKAFKANNGSPPWNHLSSALVEKKGLGVRVHYVQYSTGMEL